MRSLIQERLRTDGAPLLQCEIVHRALPKVPTQRAARQEDDDEGGKDQGEGGTQFADEDSVGRVALSSETPIKRVGWFGDVWVEILDHGDGAIRMERVEQGLAMLAEHARVRLAGKWVEGAVEDGVLRAKPVFSRNAFATEVRQDVLDGIRSTTSIGYRVWNAQLEAVDEDGVETWRFTDWEPLEASWEVIPADLAVGVGRSAAHQPAGRPKEEDDMAKRDEGTQPAGAGAGQRAHDDGANGNRGEGDAPRVTVEDLRKEETTRIRHLRQLGQLHRLEETRVEKWINGGTEFVDASRELLEHARKHPPTPTTPPSSARDPLGLSEQDRQRYSLRSAILQILEQRSPGEGEEPGFETEVSRALEKYVPGEYKRRGGILVPSGILQRSGQLDGQALQRLSSMLSATQRRQALQLMTRAGLDTQTQFKGQEAVFEEFVGFIELLRTRAMVLQLGATFLPGLQGNASFVKQTAAAVAEWVAENPGADVSDTELALALVTLIPKTLMGSTFYTRQLLRQAVIAVDALVEIDLVAVHARALDKAAIHGSGANNEPEGVYLATGVNAVDFAGPVTYPKIVEMETAIAEADGDVDSMAYLTTPGIRGAAKTTLTFPGANAAAGGPIWTGSVREGMMNGYRAAASNQVRADLGATPTPADHGLVFGDWASLMIGEWGILELIADPFTKKKQGIIEVTSFQMADVRFRHAEKFSKATTLTLT